MTRSDVVSFLPSSLFPFFFLLFSSLSFLFFSLFFLFFFFFFFFFFSFFLFSFRCQHEKSADNPRRLRRMKFYDILLLPENIS